MNTENQITSFHVELNEICVSQEIPRLKATSQMLSQIVDNLETFIDEPEIILRLRLIASVINDYT